MKTIYTVQTRYLNGTVTLSVHEDNFTSSELAEKVAKKLKEVNKEHVIVNLIETTLYEDEGEVPILNNNKDDTDYKKV